MAKISITDKERFMYKPKELQDKVNEYFDYCHENCRYPTYPGLAKYLDTRVAVLDYWRNGEMDKTHRSYAIVMQKATERMSDELQQRKDPVAIFSLKQPVYGGYSDKAPGDNEISVTLSFGKTSKDKVEKWGK